MICLVSIDMGKTRNHYLVSKNMDEEETTIHDCKMSLETEIDDHWYTEIPDRFNDSYDCEVSVTIKDKEAQKTPQKENKQWSGNVVKGVPTLYQLALDALPPKTRMHISKFVLPDTTRT